MEPAPGWSSHLELSWHPHPILLLVSIFVRMYMQIYMCDVNVVLYQPHDTYIERLDLHSRCNEADAISQLFVSGKKSMTSGHWILFISSNIPHFWSSGNVKVVSSDGITIPLFTGAEIRNIGKRKWVWGPKRQGLNSNSISI